MRSSQLCSPGAGGHTSVEDGGARLVPPLFLARRGRVFKLLKFKCSSYQKVFECSGSLEVIKIHVLPVEVEKGGYTSAEDAAAAAKIDTHALVIWEGYHERGRCSRNTYPESYITKYTSIRRENHVWVGGDRSPPTMSVFPS